MKLYALPSLYRQAQFKKVRAYEKDVADMMELPVPVTEEIWTVLSKIMLETDITELRRLVTEIEQKIADGGKRFGGDQGPAQ